MRIGIDLGGTNVRMGVVENNVIVKKIADLCKSDQPQQVVVDHMKQMLYQIVTPEVKSIGIGVPSVVDSEKGIIYNVMNIPSWKEVHLKKILEDEFKIPVSVNNDCNCFALGEYYFGKGKDYKDLVCVALGTGVGSGIIVDGKLYNGGNTGAGEIGSLPYLQYDYESYCSSSFFTREYGLTGKEAFDRAAYGDEEALRIWGEIGTHIGNLMKATMFTYDPLGIIIGGSISKAYTYFSPSMMDTLNTFPYPETIKKLDIQISTIEDVSILGASVLEC